MSLALATHYTTRLRQVVRQTSAAKGLALLLATLPTLVAPAPLSSHDISPSLPDLPSPSQVNQKNWGIPCKTKHNQRAACLQFPDYNA